MHSQQIRILSLVLFSFSLSLSLYLIVDYNIKLINSLHLPLDQILITVLFIQYTLCINRFILPTEHPSKLFYVHRIIMLQQSSHFCDAEHSHLPIYLCAPLYPFLTIKYYHRL